MRDRSAYSLNDPAVSQTRVLPAARRECASLRIAVCRLPWRPAIDTAGRVRAPGFHLEPPAVSVRGIARDRPETHAGGARAGRAGGGPANFGLALSGAARSASAAPDSLEMSVWGTAKTDETGVLAVSAAGVPAVPEISRAARSSQFIRRPACAVAPG